MSELTQMVGQQMVKTVIIAEQKVTQVSIRLTSFQTWQLDRIRILFSNIQRTVMITKLIECALTDAIESMGLSSSDQRATYNAESMNMTLEEYQSKINDTGFFIGGEKIDLTNIQPLDSDQEGGEENV
jgi:hypothetical protein